jgi:hypothetical protein
MENAGTFFLAKILAKNSDCDAISKKEAIWPG